MRHVKIFALSAVLLMICLSCFAAVGDTDGGSDDVDRKTVKELYELGTVNSYWAQVGFDGTTYTISNLLGGDPCIVDGTGFNVAFDASGVVIPEGSGFISNEKCNLAIMGDISIEGALSGHYSAVTVYGKLLIDGGAVNIAEPVMSFENHGYELTIDNGGKIEFMKFRYNSIYYTFKDVTNDTADGKSFSLMMPKDKAPYFYGTVVGTSEDSCIKIENGIENDGIIFGDFFIKNVPYVWMNTYAGKIWLNKDVNLLNSDAVFVLSKNGIEGRTLSLNTERHSIALKYATYDDTEKKLSAADVYLGVFDDKGYLASYLAIIPQGTDGVDFIKQKFDGIVVMQYGVKYNLDEVFEVHCKSGYKFDRWYYEDENGVMTVVSDPANFVPTCNMVLYAKAVEENTTDYSGFFIALIVILAIIVIAAIVFFLKKEGKILNH